MFVKRQSMRESSGVFLGQALLPGTKRRHNPPFFFLFLQFRFINPQTAPGSLFPPVSEINCRISSSAAILSTFQQIDRSKKKNNPRAIFRFIKHALAEPLSLTHTHMHCCAACRKHALPGASLHLNKITLSRVHKRNGLLFVVPTS